MSNSTRKLIARLSDESQAELQNMRARHFAAAAKIRRATTADARFKLTSLYPLPDTDR